MTSTSIACLALVATATCASLLRAAPPNIVFIMADDLGYGDLGCYGQVLIETPHLDQLAASGMRFTQFYAGSTVCAPSRCVLMTGLHTGHCFIRGNSKDSLRAADVTVAEVLRRAGYTTGLMGKWGLGQEGSTGIPTRQGFDYFFGYLDQHHAHNYYPSFLIRNEIRVPLANDVPGSGDYGDGVASSKRQYSHELIVEEAMEFVSRSADRPFFLYLALTIPHANNEARQRGMEVPDPGQYGHRDWPEPQKGHAAMISRMDHDIGRMMALLRELRIDERTIVFFTSDNGPHREGGHDPGFANSNGPLRGIKRSLHEGGIRVPMIVNWPGRIQPASVSGWVGGFQDVLPTLAELAGGTDHLPRGIDGISFVPTLLTEGSQADHEFLFWAFFEGGTARAIRHGKWKAVQQPITRPIRLYDLSSDVGENHNLAMDHPERVEQLAELMEQAYETSERWQLGLPAGSERKREEPAAVESHPLGQ